MDYSSGEPAHWHEASSECLRLSYPGPSEVAPSAPPNADFHAVYAEHHEFACSALLRLGVREQDLQDAAQQVFIVVFTKLPQFEYRASLRTWIFRICINTASDYRRAAPMRREVATEPSQIDFLSGPADDLLERSEARHRAGVAQCMLNRLSKARREVFVLFEIEQMSGLEIASELGIALGTVRSRLRLARKFLAREAQRVLPTT